MARVRGEASGERSRSREVAPRHEQRHARTPRPDHARRSDRSDGLDHRRERHRQGTGRARASPEEPAFLQTICRDQLRRVDGDAAGERAIRPREGRVYRGRRSETRAPGIGRRRHFVPRRDRRDALEPASETAARAAAARVRARRRNANHEAGRPLHCGHEPQLARGDPQRIVPPGSVLPLERRFLTDAGTARAS
jgi:hypothetical protein